MTDRAEDQSIHRPLNNGLLVEVTASDPVLAILMADNAKLRAELDKLKADHAPGGSVYEVVQSTLAELRGRVKAAEAALEESLPFSDSDLLEAFDISQATWALVRSGGASGDEAWQLAREQFIQTLSIDTDPESSTTEGGA